MYKQTHALDERLAESARIRDRYPGRVPVIVERAPRADVPVIDKAKWVPCVLLVTQRLSTCNPQHAHSSQTHTGFSCPAT